MRENLFIAVIVLVATSGAVAQPYSPKPKYERELLRFSSWPIDVESVAVTADGKLLAVGTVGWKDKEPKIHIVNAATGKSQRTLVGHESSVMSLAFSMDGQRLYSGSEDSTIGVWDVATGKEIKRIDGHQDRVTALAVSADGKRLLSCTGWSRGGKEPEEFRLWDIEKSQTVKRFPVPAPVKSRSNGAFVVKIAPDLGSALLIVGDPSYGNDLFLVDLTKGDSVSLQWKSDQQYSYTKACAISPNSKFGVSAHGDRKIRYWDLQQKKLLREIQAPRKDIIGLAISPDGSRVALDHDDGAVRIWDTKTDSELLQLEATGGRSFIGWGDILFCPNGDRLVTTGGGFCFLWDVTTAK